MARSSELDMALSMFMRGFALLCNERPIRTTDAEKLQSIRVNLEKIDNPQAFDSIVPTHRTGTGLEL